MPRYIDDDKAYEVLTNYYNHKSVIQHYALRCALSEVPTADVVERKKGKWSPYVFGNERWHQCSACGKADEYINELGLVAVRKYCPNCGAEMENE